MNDPKIEARRWLRQAQQDLEVVRLLRDNAYYAQACFHSQQAAEKAPKAVLYAQGHRIVLGHAVSDLVARCRKVDDATFGTLSDDASLLDLFYIPTRYPNGLPSPAVPGEMYTESQAESAYRAAAQVLQAVEEFLQKTFQGAGEDS